MDWAEQVVGGTAGAGVARRGRAAPGSRGRAGAAAPLGEVTRSRRPVGAVRPAPCARLRHGCRAPRAASSPSPNVRAAALAPASVAYCWHVPAIWYEGRMWRELVEARGRAGRVERVASAGARSPPLSRSESVRSAPSSTIGGRIAATGSSLSATGRAAFTARRPSLRRRRQVRRAPAGRRRPAARSRRPAPCAPGAAARRSRSVGVASDASAASSFAVRLELGEQLGQAVDRLAQLAAAVGDRRAAHAVGALDEAASPRRGASASSPTTSSDCVDERGRARPRSRSRISSTSLASWSAGFARRIVVVQVLRAAGQPGAELVHDDREALAVRAAERGEHEVEVDGRVRALAAARSARPPPSPSGWPSGVPGRHCTNFSPIRLCGRIVQLGVGAERREALLDLHLHARLAVVGELDVAHRRPPRAPAIFTSWPGIRLAALSKIASTR